MNRPARRVLLVVAALLSQAGAAAGQRLVDDWLVRTGAGPGALQPGSSAAFLNPAGIGEQRGRGSLMIHELLAPEGTGVDVLALSGGWRLDERTTLAVGYQHLSVGDIDFTTESPEAIKRLDVSQDLFAAGAARRLSARLQVGAGAQYLRSSKALDEKDQLAIGAGVRLLAPLPVPVTLAGYAYSVQDRLVWGAGAEVVPPLPLEAWRTSVSVGMSGGQSARGTSYRAGISAGWRDVVEVAGSLTAEPDAAERQWDPLLSGLVRLSRYELGVVREWLPNSFGTVHTFRFGIAF